MELNLKGNSGYDVYLEDGVVFKECKWDKEKSERLRRSFIMQKMFTQGPYLHSPELKGAYELEPGVGFGFSMEFIGGVNPLLSGKHIDLTLRAASYVSENIKASTMIPYKPEVFLNKIDSVKSNIHKNRFLYKAREVIYKSIDILKEQFQEGVILPSGDCHGDLTFNNMIYSNDKLYTFDLLPSFINSPMLDICKLRQDTEFGWINCYEKISGKTLKETDTLIHDIFKSHNFYLQHYKKMQALNMLRILPYCYEKKKAQIAIEGMVHCIR